jgi:hypothetical protein
MYKALRLYLIFVFLLLLSSSILAIPINVNIAPSTYYSDTNSISVNFTFNTGDAKSQEFILTPNSSYLFTGDKICNSFICNTPNINAWKYEFSTNWVEGTVTYKLNLNQANSRTSDNFTWSLCTISGVGCQVVSLDQTSLIQPVNPGNPTFNLVLKDMNKDLEETKFGKTSPVQIQINQLWDNVDDAGQSNISCTYTIKKNGTVVKGPTTITSWTATETYTDHIWDTFALSDLGGVAGSYDIYATCNDGYLPSEEKHIPFTFEDKPTKVDISSFIFDPSTVYPDGKVKCSATLTDEDDIPDLLAVTYAWSLNGVAKTPSSEFNCSGGVCKSGDKLICTITPTITGGIKGSKEISVSSHFTDVKISAPYKVQVNQEETYTANVNYNGTGTVTYSWIFGDGITGTGKSLKHKYTTKGNYSVILNVSDAKGSTGTANASVSTVDADLIILVKSPTLNQELVKGDSLTVKASLTDNTGTAVSDGNVIANLKSGDKIFNTTQLKLVSGIYEGSLPISYLTSTTLEVEFIASSKKSGVSLTNKKIIPVTSTAIDSLQPIFSFDLKYLENKDDSFTVGNIINTIKVCFKLPDNSFDDAMQGKLVVSGAKDLEFKLEELEDKCYNLYPNYKILKEDLDTGITLKFKDTKDLYDNYIKASNVKKFSVLALPKVFDLVLIEPSIDKTNYGQTIYVKAKPVVKEGFIFSDLKELKGQILYAGKTYDLSYNDENSEKVFSGSFKPDLEGQVKFTVFVSGTYKGALVEESASRTLDATNELKVQVLSPNESGVLDSLGKVIISVNYQNNTLYENDTLTLNLNDENTVFNKIKEGKYAGAFVANSADVGVFKSGPLELKGQDSKGNTINYNVDVPTMSWKIPMFVYDIFAGIIIVIVLMGIVMTRLSSKTRKLEKMYANKNADELQDELTVAKQTLGELQRKFFKQEVSEDVFKTQKIELEKKVQLLESKLKVEDLHEQKVHEVSREFVNNMSDDKKQMLEKKLNFQSDSYAKYKEDIDTISAKLKPFKDKYSPEDIRVAIKQSKELPEDVVDKIISKIFD